MKFFFSAIKRRKKKLQTQTNTRTVVLTSAFSFWFDFIWNVYGEEKFMKSKYSNKRVGVECGNRILVNNGDYLENGNDKKKIDRIFFLSTPGIELINV